MPEHCWQDAQQGGKSKRGNGFILMDVEPASLFLIKREVTFCSLALLSSVWDYPRSLPCFTHHFFSLCGFFKPEGRLKHSPVRPETVLCKVTAQQYPRLD